MSLILQEASYKSMYKPGKDDLKRSNSSMLIRPLSCICPPWLCKAHASFESAATARCLREAVDAARGRGSRTRSRGAWRCVRLRGTVADPTIKGPYGITAGSARCRRSRPGNLHLGPLRGLQRSRMQGERPFNGLTIACSNPCSSNRS